jgi:hypothetical protein
MDLTYKSFEHMNNFMLERAHVFYSKSEGDIAPVLYHSERCLHILFIITLSNMSCQTHFLGKSNAFVFYAEFIALVLGKKVLRQTSISNDLNHFHILFRYKKICLNLKDENKIIDFCLGL